MALIQFQSNDNYQIALIGNSDTAVVGTSIYVSGYPLPTKTDTLSRQHEFTAGIISSILPRENQGYTMRYQAVTRRGMSGGPVFNSEGKVIGIHGKGDTVAVVETPLNWQSEEIKTGLNSAIPINIFVSLLSQQKERNLAGYKDQDILSSLATSPVGKSSSKALGEGQFFCDQSTGVPVTVYRTPQGKQEPWIIWTSGFFSDSGYDPITRCETVTKRLETYRRDRVLKYITVGTLNNFNVICTASVINGPCQGLIYTLRPQQDPIRTLNNLFVWLNRKSPGSSVLESGTIPYIDVQSKLEEMP